MLRPYQLDALAQIAAHYRAGRKRVLLHLPTGGGKTVIFSEVLKRVAARGKRAIMAVQGRQLVDQASERLLRENVAHGVHMAGHWNRRPSELIQICSIDTLNARSQYPDADLVVIDEAHMSTSPKFHKFVERYPNAFFLPVTATPYTREPLSHVAEVVVAPISMRDLIAQGYLVPARYFAPSSPDMKGVKKQNGDFVSSQAEERMSTLTGDIVEHWKRYGQNRPTILFACNLQHSKSLVQAFLDNGISAEHLEGDNSFRERKGAVERLRNGDTRILSNCGVLCTGVDIPFLGCIIMARPTQSYNLFVQQVGRGTRAFPDKQDFILLDHAGNVLRHGFVTDEPEVELEGRRKEVIGGDEPVICKACFQIYVRGEIACPHCGASRENSISRERKIAEQVDGVLTEIQDLPEAVAISAFVRRLKETQKRRGYKSAWIHFQLKDKYGEDVANRVRPLRRAPPWVR